MSVKTFKLDLIPLCQTQALRLVGTDTYAYFAPNNQIKCMHGLSSL